MQKWIAAEVIVLSVSLFEFTAVVFLLLLISMQCSDIPLKKFIVTFMYYRYIPSAGLPGISKIGNLKPYTFFGG